MVFYNILEKTSHIDRSITSYIRQHLLSPPDLQSDIQWENKLSINHIWFTLILFIYLLFLVFFLLLLCRIFIRKSSFVLQIRVFIE